MEPATTVAAAAETFGQLRNDFAQLPGFIACVDSLQKNESATFDSVWGSSCALLAAALATKFDSVLLVTGNTKSQDRLIDDLATFHPGRIERFPSCAFSSELSAAVDLEYGDRLRLVKSLAAGEANPMIVASVPALLQPTPSREAIESNSRRMAVGDRVDIESFTEWLLEHKFHPTSAVELPGEFSSRGGIIDVFPPDLSSPVRIELFDDEIESLRHFDPATQRSISDLKQFEVTVLTQASDLDDAAGHFLDYLPTDAVIVLVEPDSLAEHADQFAQRTTGTVRLYPWDDTRQQMAGHRVATASALTSGHLGAAWQLPVESVERFAGDIGEVRTQVERLAHEAAGGPMDVHVVASVAGELPRVKEILSTTASHGNGRLHYHVGCVHEGFRVRDLNQVIVGCDQIFGRTDLRRKGRRRLGKAIDSFLDLRDGDLIVHLSHGIGRFRGLKMLDKEGQRTEHLELEFFGGTRIYVPASKIDLVQKYIGGTKRRPVLAKIGNVSWAKQKKAVQAAVEDLASEMIELEAKRAGRVGIKFNRDTVWQEEFEQSFPFRETDDQLTAIQAIKDDMMSTQPMDRLLCGDVGFGKTEVAMRAAFKAVENGYQVGVLVPTTILAEQHWKNFRQRMAEFPLEIVKLSRFCSTAEMKTNLAKIKSGEADIAIGTHRLVSKDVQFQNLGLVVIDEEQRFGVGHKERLKNLRSMVDVLTMSATPIPRTLHMSLVGVRDISNLETAPEDRRPVTTKVTRSNDEIIRTGIMRELARGGQVFFVHNRVKDILLVKEKIQRLVPDASIRIGHGQMDETELEDVMTAFIAGDFDVLVATTIVESGLDIPNANTIFIDEADRYGLSDLHQLRGRVGRYKHKAYCNLLISPHKHLNPTAAKRLQAIETFSQMGAGFQISMRDLEIRGAGNLLGTQQSGHIATVGYEMYCQLLEKAVRHLKHMPARLSIHVDIDLPVEAYLPDEYIEDRRQKIDMYRRLTRLENFDQVAELSDEMRDRFGPLPPPVKRLLNVSRLKLEASLWQITAIHLMDDKYLAFDFADRKRFETLSKARPMVRIIDEHRALVTLKSTAIAPNKLISLVKSLLQPPK